MADFVDSSGKRLADYPRPSVAVDTALLTVDADARLSVLLVRRPGRGRAIWALPGTFLHEHERLADAVRRSLLEKAGVTGLEPRQLTVLDDPKRDDRGWVLSVAHLETIRFEDLAPHLAGRDDVVIRPVDDLPRLAFDHNAVVDAAVEELQEQYSRAADPRRFVNEPFTLAQLQRVHDAIGPGETQKDTFRRFALPFLRHATGKSEGTVGRPAQLFRQQR
jgi:ADP-ribose pyrophosphatase YjhB (NUDIX family)